MPPEDIPAGSLSNELLAVVPFFSELSVDERNRLADSVSVFSFLPNEEVVVEGSAGESLFIVLKGVLNVITKGPAGNPVYVATLSAGDFFGEISLLLGRPRTATVSAASPAICLEIGKASWDELQKALPKLRNMLEGEIQARAKNSAEAVVADYRRRKAAVEGIGS